MNMVIPCTYHVHTIGIAYDRLKGLFSFLSSYFQDQRDGFCVTRVVFSGEDIV